MKTFKLILALAVISFGMFGCIKDTDDYLIFVGTWGVKTIDYYNTDFYGAPIENTITTYEFTPGDVKDGIDLVFWPDHSGEMRDRSRDTIIVKHNTNPVTYDTIVCPDTTIVTAFTYRYHKDDNILDMRMQFDRIKKYEMRILNFSDSQFTYENEYDANYMEKAVMVRLSTVPKSKDRNTSRPTPRPFKEGSLMSGYSESLHQ